MAPLVDLFNPSFFIILGIVVLLIALTVVYFESKMRQHNHKIASMLSLVSTLAEDMTNVKMGLNHLAVTNLNGGGVSLNTPFQSQNLGTNFDKQSELNLIEVSDDESEDNDSEDNESEDNESEDNDSEEDTVNYSQLEIGSESDKDDINDIDDIDDINDIDDIDDINDIDDSDNIKVVKLTITENNDDEENFCEETNDLEFGADDYLEGMESSNDIPEISQEYTEEVLSLKYDEANDDKTLDNDNVKLEESVLTTSSDLKTVSINLGDETYSEHIDFKKLQLPKLRNIAVEKGLTSSSEAQKLKKQEILKLLGVE